MRPTRLHIKQVGHFLLHSMTLHASAMSKAHVPECHEQGSCARALQQADNHLHLQGLLPDCSKMIFASTASVDDYYSSGCMPKHCLSVETCSC